MKQHYVTVQQLLACRIFKLLKQYTAIRVYQRIKYDKYSCRKITITRGIKKTADKGCYESHVSIEEYFCLILSFKTLDHCEVRTGNSMPGFCKVKIRCAGFLQNV